MVYTPRFASTTSRYLQKRRPTQEISATYGQQSRVATAPQERKKVADTGQSSRNAEVIASSSRLTAYTQQAAANQRAALAQQRAAELEAAKKADEEAAAKAKEEAEKARQAEAQQAAQQQTAGTSSDLRSQLVSAAQAMLGTPYAWGGGGYGVAKSKGIGKGTTNVVGVDCSGLTSYVYSTIGVKLARQSDAQLKSAGYKTSISNLQPGDLVGWNRGGHVAIYIGNGMIIESPKPGQTVRTRQLYASEGAFGVKVTLPGE